MSNQTAQFRFLDSLRTALADGSFLKMTLSRPVAQADGLKNIFLREIELKSLKKIQFTYRFTTRDEVKNFDHAELFD